MKSFPGTIQDRLMAAAYLANIPMHIVGNPGTGKTSHMAVIAKSWNAELETIIGSTRESSDFLGLPIEVNGDVRYSTFSWVRRLQKAGDAILFLDEFNTADESTMKGMLRVVQEREVGEAPLGDGVRIYAASNPTDQAVDGIDLPAPMANRFLHMKWTMDRKAWMDGILYGFESLEVRPLRNLITTSPATRGPAVRASITRFLTSTMVPSGASGNIFDPAPPSDPVKAGGAWPSPRSWHNAVQVLSWLDAADLGTITAAMNGLVGEEATGKYVAWIVANDLYDPVAVLNGTVSVDWRDPRADRLFALCGALGAIAVDQPKTWERVVELLVESATSGGRPDISQAAAAKLASRIPRDKTLPESFMTAWGGLFSKGIRRIASAA